MRRFAIVAALLFVVPPVLRAAPPVLAAEGTDAFRDLLGRADLKPLDNFAEALRAPTRTLVVVFGGAGDLDCTSRQLRQFVIDGGAVLFATDQASAGLWRNAFGVQVRGSRVVTLTPSDRFQPQITDKFDFALSECPRLVPGAKAKPDLFAGLSGSVYVNRASYLSPTRFPGVNVLAEYPRTVLIPSSFRWVADAGGVAALGGQLDEGRMLALADHSIFTNALMIPSSTGNYDFASNIVDWLTVGPDGARTHCYMLEEGELVREFPTLDSLPDIPLPSLNDLIAKANTAIMGLEREDAFNRVINNRLPLNRQLSILLGLATVALIGLVAARFVRQRWTPTEPRMPVLPPTPPSFEQRHEQLVRADNLYPLVRFHLQKAFAELGFPEDAAPPRVVAISWFWRRWWQQHVARLWELATDEPQRLTLDECRRVRADLRRLEIALSAGTVRLEPT